MELQGSGHGGGHVSSQGSNLGVNVSEEGVGGPPAQLHDEGIILSIEFESHGSRGSQAVGANTGKVEVSQASGHH